MIDLAHSADKDILLYEVSDSLLEKIDRSLSILPNSSSDRSVGNMMIREIEGFDIVWITGREGQDIVVTIGRIRPVDPRNPTAEISKILGTVAIFRGSTGV